MAAATPLTVHPSLFRLSVERMRIDITPKKIPRTSNDRARLDRPSSAGNAAAAMSVWSAAFAPRAARDARARRPSAPSGLRTVPPRSGSRSAFAPVRCGTWPSAFWLPEAGSPRRPTALGVTAAIHCAVCGISCTGLMPPPSRMNGIEPTGRNAIADSVVHEARNQQSQGRPHQCRCDQHQKHDEKRAGEVAEQIHDPEKRQALDSGN